MYLILLSTSIALLTGIAVHLLLGGWVLALLLAIVAMIACQILVGRRLIKRIQPTMDKVKRQLEARMIEPAIETLEGLLALAPWVPLLRGQVNAQIGVLMAQTGNQQKALAYLAKSSRRVTEAQLLLAAMHERNGDLDAMRSVLLRAAPMQKKSALFHNVHAYLLHKHGDTAGAMARLAKFVEKDATSEVSKDNLLRLQNDRKLNLKAFGMPWYMLGFERPPASMGQMQVARKGFRQPPKQPKRKAK